MIDAHDGSTLETLLENYASVDLSDIRSKQKFAAMHIPGARSVPLAKLAEARMFRRVRAMTDRVHVISDDRGRASLACGFFEHPVASTR